MDVLDQHLADNTYICGDDYTIADMAIWAWYGQLVLGMVYDAAEFLQAQSYANLQRWAQLIQQRPAVQRALKLKLQPIA